MYDEVERVDMQDKQNGKELDFKAGLARLEEIVESLESGEADLEDALKYFDEGIRLSERLSGKLARAEKKIHKLVEEADGSLKTEIMEEEDVD
jgi:exodeoxyribonuclease VII small subunit